MILDKTSFFEDLDDPIQVHNWSFKNPNVSSESSTGQKRQRKDVVLQESDMSFGELGLSKPLVKACSDLGFLNPTEIQEKVIPLILKNSDVMICAKTGSGKTGAFSLPILHKLTRRDRFSKATRCIILSPTRELCQQIHSMIENYIKYTDLVARVVFGGANSAKEQKQLQENPDIIVGTPGRVLDHILNTKDFSFEHVEFLVLDEADRLLDMGFTDELTEIIKELPKDRQTVLASATLGERVKGLVNLALKNPVRVGKEGIPDSLKQVIVRMKEDWTRESVVVHLLSDQVKGNVIVFCRTKADCHRMFKLLELLGFSVGELHGHLPQSARLKALEDFQNGVFTILIATDLASRGLDLPVDTVINMHIPEELSKLKHRIGRTARAGQDGISINLCNEDERTLVRKTIKKSTVGLALDSEKLAKVRDKVEKKMNKVREVIKEEMIEKELARAEIEASKAKNLIDYADEIYNKPKKEWIVKKKDIKKTQDIENLGSKKDKRELHGKILKHKLMMEGYKNAAKGIKNIEKHISKAQKKNNKKQRSKSK
jgi:ATP-dependent RNA helicase DDX27